MRTSSKDRPNLNELEKKKRWEKDWRQWALRGTGGQILCICIVIASGHNMVPLRKGLGAVRTRVCQGPDPAHDTACVK